MAIRISKPEADGADPRKTLNGWLRHLQPFASRELKVEDLLDVVYQVLHRAASACAVAADRALRPEVVYLHFDSSPLKSSATKEQYVSDLQLLRSLLGNPEGIGFTVVEMPLHPTAAFDRIKHLDKSATASADEVAAALCSGPLFTFGEPEIVRV